MTAFCVLFKEYFLIFYFSNLRWYFFLYISYILEIFKMCLVRKGLNFLFHSVLFNPYKIANILEILLSSFKEQINLSNDIDAERCSL